MLQDLSFAQLIGLVSAAAIVGVAIGNRRRTRGASLDDERRRLARDLCDDLGQSLTAMRFEVEALRGGAFEDRTHAALTRLSTALDRAHGSVHSMLRSLRLPPRTP